jgi:acetyl-CoA acetyltransferase
MMNEVVIVSAVRTPVGRIRGILSQVRPLLFEMQPRAAEGEKMRYGLVRLCVGVGQGEATIVELSQ